ncbi:probable G-protein coupled receptor 139 [Leucoraja erinacea]|uniref:probable G-protein coupled receptor 139 n=1 Tax=Leucoraja erinaceus TaxID=7782 RepID=UPI00245713C9|nr:probable G-protein coupled receptor 139 [Leucoraja erinacea]
MAVTDLLTIITEVMLYQISYHYFPGSVLNVTPMCSVVRVLRRAAIDCSVWFTVAFTFDRFVAICCQKLKTKYCSRETAAIVLSTTGLLLCLKNIPHYFTVNPIAIINNVPWGCNPKLSFYTTPLWVGFDWFDTILNPLLPFVLILLFNALTGRYVLVASRIRKGLRGEATTENRTDPEMESRRRSVILLFTLSASFILLWTVTVIEFLYYTATGKIPGDFTVSEYILAIVGVMLLNLNCCTNTFVYVVTQSKFREQIVSAMKYPVTSIRRVMNKLIRN